MYELITPITYECTQRILPIWLYEHQLLSLIKEVKVLADLYYFFLHNM